MVLKEVGIFEAKTHLSDLIQSVEAGQSFVITKRGVKVAELRPISKEKRPLRKGCATDKGYWMAPDFNETPEGFEEYM